MITSEAARQIVSRRLSGDRLRHSLGTAALAVEFAKQTGIDPDPLQIAALLHDICKPLSLPALVQIMACQPEWIDRWNRDSAALLHGPAAAVLLREEYGCNDPGIIAAVRYHTTGHAQLPLSGILLYLADFLDPCRPFPAQEPVWIAAEISLSEALLAVLSYSFKKLNEQQLTIHPDSIEFQRCLKNGVLSLEHFRLSRPEPLVFRGSSA